MENQLTYRYHPTEAGGFGLSIWRPHGMLIGCIGETPARTFRLVAGLPGPDADPVPIDEFPTIEAAITFVEELGILT